MVISIYVVVKKVFLFTAGVWKPEGLAAQIHTPGVLFLQTLQYALCFFRSQMWPSALPRDLRVPSVPGSALIGPTNVSSESANPIGFFDELQNKIRRGTWRALLPSPGAPTSKAGEVDSVAGGTRHALQPPDLHLPMKPLTTTYLQCIYKLSRPYKMSNLQAPF